MEPMVPFFVCVFSRWTAHATEEAMLIGDSATLIYFLFSLHTTHRVFEILLGFGFRVT